MDNPAESPQHRKMISTTYPQYRQIAVIIYGCVLLVGIFDYWHGRPPTSALDLPPHIRLAIFCTALILMSMLDLINQRWRPIHPAVHLFLMIGLSLLILLVSNANYSQLLLLILILSAELTFPRWVSILTMISTFAVLTVWTAFDSPDNPFSSPERTFPSPMDVQSLTISLVFMVLIWLMARLIKQEWSNRIHLQTLHNEVKESSAQLAQMAVVHERNRMAREIHDSVGHHLAAVSIQLEMADKLHERDSAASVAAIHQAQSATREALHDVRQSVSTLRQANDTFALAPAVALLVGRIATDQLAINYHFDGDETQYPTVTHRVLFRAIQEGLTNVYKHAAASHVNIWVQFMPQQARLRIIDDGIGFDTEQQTNGIGIQGIRERVEKLGGTIMIQSHANEGTVLDIILPQPSP